MSESREHIQVEFNNKASQTFFSYFHSFEKDVASVSRKTHEFDFQKLKKSYVSSLEQELKSIARDILQNHKSESPGSDIGPLLQQLMKEYLHRFVQKINEI
jgi:hypothetical protein